MSEGRLRKRLLPYLLVLPLILVLVCAILLQLGRRHTLPPLARQPRDIPTHEEVSPSSSSDIAVPGGGEPGILDIEEEGKLRAELAIRVLSDDEKPIPNAAVTFALHVGSLGHEGPLAWGPINDDMLTEAEAFQGNRFTDSEGMTSVQMSLPMPTYAETWVSIRAGAAGFVRLWKDQYAIRLPREGERKEVTLHLVRGRTIGVRIVGVNVREEGRFWVELSERGEAGESWYSLPKVKADGTFEDTVAPRLPLRLLVKHRKYKTFVQDIDEKFEGNLDVVLQPDPTYKEKAKVVFSVSNPPPNGKLAHTLFIYSADERRIVQSPSKAKSILTTANLREGLYQVFLMSDDESCSWGHETFAVPAAGEIVVPILLGKASAVRLIIRDKKTGGIPQVTEISAEISYEIEGAFQLFFGFRVVDKASFLENGILDMPEVPPGTSRVVVKSAESYKDCVVEIRTSPGDKQDVEVLLEEEGQ